MAEKESVGTGVHSLLSAHIWDNEDAALTANKAARATAAKRSSGLTITDKE